MDKVNSTRAQGKIQTDSKVVMQNTEETEEKAVVPTRKKGTKRIAQGTPKVATTNGEPDTSTVEKRKPCFVVTLDEERVKFAGPPVIGKTESGEDIYEDDFNWKKAFRTLDKKMYGMLEEYFERAFTILVHKFGLQPKEQFNIVIDDHFGEIPIFLNEASLQYVQEISKTLATFCRRGVLEGAVFHVNMLNKENCPVTQQRVIFRPSGIFEANDIDVSNVSLVHQTMKLTRSHFVEMITDLLTLQIKELKYPWYSHWTITIGLKKEFVQLLKDNGHGHLGPFPEAPSADFFPWKKRPRLSQAVKLGLVKLLPKQPDGKIPPGVIANIVEGHKKSEGVLLNHIKSQREKYIEASCTLVKPQKTSPIKSIIKLPEWEYFSSSSESEDEAHPTSIFKSHNKLYIKPISSLEIMPELMLLVYRIEYPKNVVNEDHMLTMEEIKLQAKEREDKELKDLESESI